MAVLSPGPNTLSQTITGLEKGRLYQLEFSSFDYEHLADPRRPKELRESDVEAVVSGKVKLYPEMSQCYSRTSSKSSLKVTAFTHRLVFKATGGDAQVTFVNKAEDGHRWGLNYVGVRPYYVKNKEQFKTLLELYKESEE